MMQGLSLAVVGHARSLSLSITFTPFVAFDALFRQYAEYQSWQELLPGFHGSDWGRFFLGMAESYGYGWYVAPVWTPLYDAFALRRGRDKE